MPKVYKKGAKWWFTVVGYKVPGKRSAMPTDYKATEETREAAQKYADAAQRAIDKRSSSTVKAGPRTVTDFAEAWLLEREQRGIGSVAMDKGRLRNHALPVIGAMKLGEVEPHHIRDLMRGLKRKINDGKMAPRSALHVYGILRAMFNDALMERLIVSSPMLIPRGELPQKVDKDPEWRQLATYESHEVRSLLSDPRIPARRRVENGLKALAGLRHGEAAGLLWRNVELELDPLGRLTVARSYAKKRTKTEVTRLVPVHPELARVLRLWAALWPVRHGRAPGPDDLVVPSDRGEMVTATVAGEMFRRDLQKLGLRLPAGEERNRGGHDLRAWTISTALEHGASPEALQRITHTKRRDVQSGYTRLPWRTLCAAISAIPMQLPPDPLAASATGPATGDESAREYTANDATLTGFEPVNLSASVRSDALTDEIGSALATGMDPTWAWLVAEAATGPEDGE